MLRRTFIGVVAFASLLRDSHAQDAQKKRLALAWPTGKATDLDAINPYLRKFSDELSRLGFIEGQNFSIERHSAEGQPERFANIARDVVKSRPDVVLVNSVPLALEFKSATSDVPIVAITADPIAIGLVKSIAKPEGNITGVSIDAGIELVEKRIELLKLLVPALTSIHYIASEGHWDRPTGKAAKEAARRAGVSLVPVLVSSPISREKYEAAFRSIETDRIDAIMTSDEPAHFTNRAILVGLVNSRRAPAAYVYRETVELGGLMSYGADLGEAFLRLANQVASILKGTKPSDIPYSQPSKLQPVLNLKTAKALGLQIPQTVLLRADEVIE